jgi:pimeloyl-ACP methyl ester carboxylesterase
VEQRIGFVKLGGSRIAYATSGSGPPLVFPPGSFGHLTVELESPHIRAFLEVLASRFTLVRYDRPGTGLSDRDRPADTLTLEFEVSVLDALIDHLDLDRVSLFGFCYGGLVSAALAARRPERVRRMLLCGVYAEGGAVASPAVVSSVMDLVRADWDLGSRLITEVFLPGADADMAGWFARFRRESCSGETAASMLGLWARIDVRDVLGDITAPTLVLHRRDDRVIPARLGRALAALVPGAHFAELEGSWHQPWLGDSADVLRAAGAFLGFTPPIPSARSRLPRSPPVSARCCAWLPRATATRRSPGGWC